MGKVSGADGWNAVKNGVGRLVPRVTRHEHIWSTAHGAANVIVARPKLLRTATLLDVFQWGLEKWNIEVLEKHPKQGRLRGVD